MLALSQLTLLAGTLIVGLALAAHTLAWASDRSRVTDRSGSPDTTEAQDAAPRRSPIPVGAGARSATGSGAGADDTGPPPGGGSGVPGAATAGLRDAAEGIVDGTGAPDRAGGHPAGIRFAPGLRWYGDALILLALVSLTAGLLSRMVAVGHGPFANQYEFAVSFAWGVLGAELYLGRRRGGAALVLLVLPIALGMLLYAAAVGGQATPLVPALHHDVLLTLHVLTAVLSYGAAAVAAGAGTLYLVRCRFGGRGSPGAAALDALGYRAVVVSFPLMTLMIALGAVWADIAWGAYWSWDPKETASLVTWLIYGAYLHARVARGWRGERSAWLLVLGFAAVLFTYFGNLFLGGMHSYA